MSRKLLIGICIILMCTMGLTAYAQEGSAKQEGSATQEEVSFEITRGEDVDWDFEKEELDSIPAKWMIEATNQDGPLATWKMTMDPSSTDKGPRVLSLTETNHTSLETGNICWTRRAGVVTCQFEINFKSIGGEAAPGGGAIWRVQDKNNYYLCRANVATQELTLSVVMDGVEKVLMSKKSSLLKPDTWFEIEVTHTKTGIECQIDDKACITAPPDETIPEMGGVGFWALGDSITSFDGIEIEFDA